MMRKEALGQAINDKLLLICIDSYHLKTTCFGISQYLSCKENTLRNKDNQLKMIEPVKDDHEDHLLQSIL